MSGCLLWTGATDSKGYGHLYVRTGPGFARKRVKAYRVAWIIVNGEIPSGMNVLHRCDNTFCVNVDHLRLGTHHENVLDMARKNRGTKSASGLPYGVSPYRGRFVARVSLMKERKHLGVFDTAEQAAGVAAAAKEEILSRAQAAEAGKVRMPKVRIALDTMRAHFEPNCQGQCRFPMVWEFCIAALVELDAVEGRK
ncbi:MAG: HNH endonuclease [Deltaproteobacteria bacterium]|nr:HNH endonuclease [Deltaproteobacteria bacterium]